jgi:hypothetical protein
MTNQDGDRGDKRRPTGYPIATLIGVLAGVILAIVLEQLSDLFKDNIYFVLTLMISIFLALLFASVDVFQTFREGIHSDLHAFEALVGGKLNISLAELRSVIQGLQFYNEFVACVPTEAARQDYLKMMRSQSALAATGRSELVQIGDATLSRHSEELTINGPSEFMLKVPAPMTHPIYGAILDSSIPADVLTTVTSVDMHWWLQGHEPNLYIEKNHAALQEGRLKAIRRLFIIEHGQWNPTAMQQMIRVKEKILSGPMSSKIELFAIFDQAIQDWSLRKLDVIIRAPNLAIQWLHIQDESYPSLRIDIDPTDVSVLKQRVDAVYHNPGAKPIEEFLAAN